MLDGTPWDAAPVLTDVTLERALVALIFADNANIERTGKLTPDDLTDPTMSAAFAGALDMHAEGRPISLITLKARLEGIRLDDDRTGLDVIRSLSLGGAMPAVAEIASRLRSLAVKRRLADTLRNLAQATADESQPLPALAADGIRQLNDYLSDAISEARTAFDLHLAAHDFIDWLQTDGDAVEIPTGLAALDDATGGWHRGQFAILAGRPSMGKSCIALASMLRTALKGYGVLFFSLEMTRQQLVSRALADFAYTDPAIRYSELKPGRVAEPQVRRLLDAAERFKGLPIVIETRNGLTAGDILAHARRSAEDFKAKGQSLALVVVDHLLKVRPSSRYAGQPVKEIDEISEAMCVMAKSLDVAVLGLHQLNRQVESRDNQRPLLSDLRGSGSLEQDADVVLFAYRPAYQYERQLQDGDKAAEAEMKLEAVKNSLEIQIAKQRNGPTKTLHFFVDMAANAVRDREWRRGR